jgi:hypothetical protein
MFEWQSALCTPHAAGIHMWVYTHPAAASAEQCLRLLHMLTLLHMSTLPTAPPPAQVHHGPGW